MKRMSEIRRGSLICAAALMALVIALGGCGKKKQAETTAAPTTAAATTEAPTTAAPETKPEPTAAPTTAARQSANPVEAGELTAALEEINKASEGGGTAGSSLKAARHAAELMTWYMEEKPSGDRVMKETENYLKTLKDPSAFQSGLEQIYQAALDTVSKDGAGILSDAGFEGEITWTEKDVNRLFNAIFEGSGQKK